MKAYVLLDGIDWWGCDMSEIDTSISENREECVLYAMYKDLNSDSKGLKKKFVFSDDDEEKGERWQVVYSYYEIYYSDDLLALLERFVENHKLEDIEDLPFYEDKEEGARIIEISDLTLLQAKKIDEGLDIVYSLLDEDNEDRNETTLKQAIACLSEECNQ